MRLIGKLTSDQRGTTAIEYGLICGLIVIAIVGGLHTFASKTVNMLNNVSTQVFNAG